MRRPALLVVAGACLAPLACGGDAGGAPAVSRSDSAGIEIVRGPREDAPLEWTFRREFALGGAAEGPEAFFRVSAGDVATDTAGREVARTMRFSPALNRDRPTPVWVQQSILFEVR